MLRVVCFCAVLTVSASIGVGTLFDILPTSKTQSVRVAGRLTCNGEAARQIKVKLYEDEVVLDTLLDQQFSDADGAFVMNGTKSERSWIEPKINIYHRCNYDGNCMKKISINVPVEYITFGEEADKTFEIGTLNLAGKYPGESVDCLN